MKFISKKIMYSFILSLFFIFAITNYSFAENTPGFSVEAVLPDTQLSESENLSYFDFLVTRNEIQKLKVKVTNSSTSPITINAQLNNASTNKYGVIEYSKNVNDGTTFNTLLTNIATLDETSTTLQAGQSDEFVITINSTQKFNGAVLGGIKLQSSTNGNNGNNTPATSGITGITVKNEFAYVIAIKAQQSTNPVAPDLLPGPLVTPTDASDNTLYARIRNNSGLVVTGTTLNVKVTNRDTSRVVLRNEFKDYCFAPSSLLDLYFADGKYLGVGRYTINITISGGSLTNDININQDFDLNYPKP